jgi:hypothetical protein
MYFFSSLSQKKKDIIGVHQIKKQLKKKKKQKQFRVKLNSQASIYNTARLFNA